MFRKSFTAGPYIDNLNQILNQLLNETNYRISLTINTV